MIQLKHLLFYVDDEEPDLVALGRAVNYARQFGAKLTVAAVVEPARNKVLLSSPGFDVDNVERLLVDDRQRQLAEALDKLDARSVETEIRVLVGHPVTSVLEVAQARGVDYLAKAPAPSHGLRRQMIGSIDMQLIRACSAPVAISRAKTTEGGHRKVAALEYDGDDEDKKKLNHWILDSALLALQGEHTSIYVLHAWSLYGHSLLALGRSAMPPERLEEAVEEEQAKRQAWLEERMESYRQTLDQEQAARFNPKIEILRGDPRNVIPERVKELDADSISLGTAMRTGLSGMVIGNTAEEILDRVDSSVIVLKPVGFVWSGPPKA